MRQQRQRLVTLMATAALGVLGACNGDSATPTSAPPASATRGLTGQRTASPSSAKAASAPSALAVTPEVAYVVLRVTDLARSEAFYRDVLGMQQTFRYDIGKDVVEVAFGYPNAAGVASGAGIVLVHDPHRSEPFEHGNTFSRYVLSVPDVAATFEHLQALGLSNLRMPVRYPQFKAIVGFAQDPDGYRIEILERIPDA